MGKEYVLTVGEEEAERDEVSTAPREHLSLTDEEPSKPSLDALSLLSEQLEMALQRITALEDERSW